MERKPKFLKKNLRVVSRGSDPHTLEFKTIDGNTGGFVVDVKNGKWFFGSLPFAIGGIRYARKGPVSVLDITKEEHLEIISFIVQELIRHPGSFIH